MWNTQVPALTAAGYKVLTPDLPGFGQSEKPENVAFYKTENIVGVVLALLDELKLDKFILVGHDWGAAVAWALAFTIPHRITKLAVLSVGFPGNLFAADPEQRPKSWYTLFFQFPNAEQLLMANDWALMKQLMAGQTNEEQMKEYTSRLSEPGALTAGLNWYRANMTAEMFGSTQLAPPPGGKPLDMPVLGLWAAGDDKFLAEAGMTASAAVVAPGKWQYQCVEASSHWMMVAEPEKTSKLLVDFINKDQ
jgi:pimeloyl-ACP methyl ester carboxylesterase